MKEMGRQLGLLVSAAVLAFTPSPASAGTCEEGRAAYFDYRELQADWVDAREVLSLLKDCVEESKVGAKGLGDASAQLLLAEAQLRIARDTKDIQLYAESWRTLYRLSTQSDVIDPDVIDPDVNNPDRAAALLQRAKWREYAPKEAYAALLSERPAYAQALCGKSDAQDLDACFRVRATSAQSEELSPVVKLSPALARKAKAQRLILSYRVERTLSDADWATFAELIRTPDASSVALLRYFQADAKAEALCRQVNLAQPASCITQAKELLKRLSPTDAPLRAESGTILAQWAGDALLAETVPLSDLKEASRFLYQRTLLAKRVADAADNRGEPRADQREIVLEDGANLLVALMMHPERAALLAELKLQEKDVLTLAEDWLKVEHLSVYVSTQFLQHATLATARVKALEAIPRAQLQGSAEAKQRLDALEQVLALSVDPSTPENRAWLEGPAPVNNRDVALLAFARAAAAQYRVLIEGPTAERKLNAQRALDAFRFYVPSSSTATGPKSADDARLRALRWVPSAEGTLKALSQS